MNKCPNCSKKLSPLYFKPNCPECGVNLLYHDLEKRLAQDAVQVQREVDAVNRFTELLRKSSVASLLHIIRLVLFFTPLGAMCLPMYTVEGKTVSLIGFIMDIVQHGLDFGELTADTPYFLGVLTMALVLVLSLAEIIASLFSAAKHGLGRNLIFSAVNLMVFCALGIAVSVLGGTIGAGWILTLLIYLACDVLHFFVNKKIHSMDQTTLSTR